MKYLIFKLLFLLAAATLPAQEPAPNTSGKGVAPLVAHRSSLITHHSVRAVVIGISDYQDPAIPDLRFAHRDAGAFADFLRSPAGGALDNDHLKVLINEQATAGRVAEALDALLEQTKEGDRVILYFSGHGDVERKTVSQPGFLLCWDAPSRVYMGGGTYSLAYLQEIVATLSTLNKAKVVVITDACHAGKLAGSQIGGAQLTAASLARQFSNEIKVLSCQPGEYSLESEQWGGGRGVFSYHLVDGLFGLADRNGDQTVTLGELDHYLEDRVTVEAAPQSQVPMLLGNKTERLARVNAAILADLQRYKSGQLPAFNPVEQRGLEEEVLAGVDSNIREIYRAFKLAVQEKRFFPAPVRSGEPSAPGCAEDYYNRLVQVEALAPLRGAIKRNYAAALQDDAQQALNAILKNEIGEYNLSNYKKRLKYINYPAYLERAAELLGAGHYMYPALKARHYFFKGFVTALREETTGNYEYRIDTNIMKCYQEALKWQSDFPHAYWQMSIYCDNRDSAKLYARTAGNLAPGWIKPYTMLAAIYKNEGNNEKSDSLFQIALQLDSASAIVWFEYGQLMYSWERPFDAIPIFQKTVELEPAFVAPYISLGQCYTELRQYLRAEKMFEKAIALDSVNIEAWYRFADVCMHSHQWSKAEQALLQVVGLAPGHRYYTHLAFLYKLSGNLKEQERIYAMLYERDTSGDLSKMYAGLHLLKFYLETGRVSEADKLEKEIVMMFDSTEIAPTVYLETGSVFMESGQFSEAEKYFQQLLKITTKSAWLYYRMGLNYLLANRFDEAEKSLKMAATFEDSYFQKFAIADLGLLYRKTGRLNEAEEVSGKVLEDIPYLAQANANMAALAARRGQYAEAFTYIEKIFSTNVWWELIYKYFEEPDLAPLRELPEWEALMKKYFPDQFKD